MHTIIDSLKWAIIAYSFYMVGGYTATLCYMLLIVYEVMKLKKLHKNIFLNLILFLTSVIFLYLGGKYNLMTILPIISLFLYTVINAIYKYKYNKYVTFIVNLLIAVYSYNYMLYVLFVYKVMEIVFPFAGGSIKKVTDYFNKKIN